MKKIGILFVTIIMAVLFAVSASALTTSGQCGDNVYWSLNETTGEFIVSGTGDMYNHAISFPPNISGSKSKIKSVVIKNGVTSIGNSAFENCINMKKVTIADSVTRIGNDAFYRCSSLTDITIPDSVTHIGHSNFYETAYYKNKDNWTDGLLIINGWLVGFQNDYIRIPADVKNIQDDIFWMGLPSVNFFEVDCNNNYYCSDEYGVLYNKDKTTLISYPDLSKNKTYIIPETVEKIEKLHSLYLENLVIPKNVKEIVSNNVVSYCFKNVYIYSDNINFDTAKYFCYLNIDQEKYLKVRDEYAKICEETIEQYLKFFIMGTITEEDFEEYYCKVAEIESSFSSDENAPYGTIYANEGSTAQAYASKYGINFKLLSEAVTESKDPATGVEVSYAPNTFNGDVEFVVEEGSENANINFAGLSGLFAKFESYDISFKVDGETVQPNGKVTVKLPVPDGFNSNFICVYHVDDNGNKTLLNSKVENGFVVFETNHFSEYVIVDESSIVEEPAEPEEPTVPEEPVEPDTPDEPTTPDTPDEPEVPDTPEEPEDTDASDPCSCNCHAGGIKAFFFKLVNFFAKLFNPAKRVCVCGVKH